MQRGPHDGADQHHEAALRAQGGYGTVGRLEITLRQRKEKQEQDAHDGGETNAPSKQRRQHKQSMIQSC